MSSDGGVDAHQRGMLHYRGNTVPKSLSEAAKWFRIAADNGHAGAQSNLGIMAFLGQGMTKDYTKAAKWFRMAGEQNHAAAQYNLGFYITWVVASPRMTRVPMFGLIGLPVLVIRRRSKHCILY